MADEYVFRFQNGNYLNHDNSSLGFAEGYICDEDKVFTCDLDDIETKKEVESIFGVTAVLMSCHTVGYVIWGDLTISKIFVEKKQKNYSPSYAPNKKYKIYYNIDEAIAQLEINLATRLKEQKEKFS